MAAFSAACVSLSFSKSFINRGPRIEATIIICPITGIAFRSAVPNSFALFPATANPMLNLFSAPVAFATSLVCFATDAAAILNPCRGPALSIILKAAAVLRDVELMPFALPKAPPVA